MFKDSSRYNNRFLQRQKMKRRLPKRYRFLVGAAKRLTKKEFVANVEEAPEWSVHWNREFCGRGRPGSTVLIRQRFGITPGDFWRAVNGTLDLKLPNRPIQGDLFAALEEYD